MADAPFLKGNPATSSSKPTDEQKGANRPQQERPSEADDKANVDEKKFPNRPQPMKPTLADPKSVPSGGSLPYSIPSKTTDTPFKLGK